LICSFVDITDRKRMEEELRIKESAIASSMNGIVIADLQGNVTYINDAVLKMWGTSNPSDILGKPAPVFAQSEEEALEIMNTILTQGQWSGEIVGKIMDGSPITVHLSASLVRNEKGEPICLMCSFIDISERKRIENELKIKDRAINSSLTGIGIGDIYGNIIYVNEAALKMWGADNPSEVIGRSALNLRSPKKRPRRSFRSSWRRMDGPARSRGSARTAHLLRCFCPRTSCAMKKASPSAPWIPLWT